MKLEFTQDEVEIELRRTEDDGSCGDGSDGYIHSFAQDWLTLHAEVERLTKERDAVKADRDLYNRIGNYTFNSPKRNLK